MNEKTELGFITANGIWVNGCIYTCSLAVKQQWTKQVEQIGWWPVFIQFKGEMSDQIHLLLQDGSTELCTRIDSRLMSSKNLESYYIEFQRLMKLRKQRQSLKHKNN